MKRLILVFVIWMLGFSPETVSANDPLKLIPLSEFHGDTVQYLHQNFDVNCDNVNHHDLYDLFSQLEVKMKSFSYLVSKMSDNKVFMVRVCPYEVSVIHRLKQGRQKVPYVYMLIVRMPSQYESPAQFKSGIGGGEPDTWLPLTPEAINVFKGFIMGGSATYL